MTDPAILPRAKLAIIVPVLDEAEQIVGRLLALQDLRARGCELIVVDGGSGDGTAELAAIHADRVLSAPRGRASQMNAGAAATDAAALVFVHADTSLPRGADRAIAGAIAEGAVWGRFDVRIDGRPRLLRVVEAAMNLRSRLTGIATCDQAIFVRREAFAAVGGFPDQALMEDIALSSRLRQVAAPACLRETVLTSARRWTRHGVLRTIFLMWRLRAAYFFGADPQRLAIRYGYAPRER